MSVFVERPGVDADTSTLASGQRSLDLPRQKPSKGPESALLQYQLGDTALVRGPEPTATGVTHVRPAPSPPPPARPAHFAA